MLRTDDLHVFVLTAELGSLSAAARQLELSPAVASAALKRLEAGLNCRLLVRSTRSLRLTGEGEHYLPHARSALQSLLEGQQLLAGGKATISGPLQLSAPSDFGRNVLLPWLDEFQLQHPLLSLRLLLADRNADLFRQPVDIALRYGQPEDSSLVALPVASTNRRVLCAAPSYIATHGAPASLADLSGHNCLRYMLAGRVHERWGFHDGRRPLEQTVKGDRISDDADVVRRWALAGRGVVYKSWLDVAQDVQAERLVVLLPRLLGEAAPLNLICAHRAHLGETLRLLREHLSERCHVLLEQAPFHEW